jgi:HD-like signal output (HDOD) protein
MAIDWTKLRQHLIGDRNESVMPPKVKLPTLPHALIEFNRKAEDPEAGPAELGRIIESDTGLTCDLLRYVNSSTFGLRNKASTAQQAIAMLGIRAAKLFLISAGVEHAMKACKSKLINLQAFCLTNLERALFAKAIARRLRADGDLAYAASMLQDFLLPTLSNELFDTYFKYAQTPENVRRPLVDFEKSTLGWDHPLATAQVLMAWKFPDDLTCCVLLQHGGLAVLCDPEVGRSAAAAVAVAGLMPDILRQSGDGLGQLLKLNELWPDFDLAETSRQVSEQLDAMSPLAGQHVSLARRLEKLLVPSK